MVYLIIRVYTERVLFTNSAGESEGVRSICTWNSSSWYVTYNPSSCQKNNIMKTYADFQRHTPTQINHVIILIN